MIPKDFLRLQMIRKDSKKIPKDSKRLQKISNDKILKDFERFQKISKDSKRFLKIPKDFKKFQELISNKYFALKEPDRAQKANFSSSSSSLP